MDRDHASTDGVDRLFGGSGDDLEAAGFLDGGLECELGGALASGLGFDLDPDPPPVKAPLNTRLTRKPKVDGTLPVHALGDACVCGPEYAVRVEGLGECEEDRALDVALFRRAHAACLFFIRAS